jgi:hypothetical protein
MRPGAGHRFFRLRSVERVPDYFLRDGGDVRFHLFAVAQQGGCHDQFLEKGRPVVALVAERRPFLPGQSDIAPAVLAVTGTNFRETKAQTGSRHR